MGLFLQGREIMIHKKNRRKWGAGLLIIGLVFSLSGCTKKPTPGEQAFQYMEKAASQEANFNAQQQPLVQEEQKEQSIYNQIMKLDMKHFNEIKAKSGDALKSIEKRSQLIQKEKASIDQAETTFKKAVPLLKQVKRSKSKPYAEALIKDMSDRYASFQNLYTLYNQSLDEEKTLFTMLQTKGLTVQKLQGQLDKVNASYKKINKEKQTFNNDTIKFNKDKQNFYKSMNIMGDHSG